MIVVYCGLCDQWQCDLVCTLNCDILITPDCNECVWIVPGTEIDE